MTSTATAHQVPVLFILPAPIELSDFNSLVQKQNVCAAGLVHSQFHQHELEEKQNKEFRN